MASTKFQGGLTLTWEDYHSPNFIHPDFAPYVPVLTRVGPRGRPVKTYPGRQVGSLFRNVDGTVLRMGAGKSFVLKYPNDPCPAGWVKDPSRPGVCVDAPSYQGTFYSDEMWAPTQSGLRGPAVPLRANQPPSQSGPWDQRVASQQGGYDVTYESKPHHARTKALISSIGVIDESAYGVAETAYAPAPRTRLPY